MPGGLVWISNNERLKWTPGISAAGTRSHIRPSPPSAAGPQSSAPAAATPPPISGLAAPSEVKGKVVDDIIAGWAAELEARAKSFAKHAAALAEWDRAILSNRKTLLQLETEVSKVGV